MKHFDTPSAGSAMGEKYPDPNKFETLIGGRQVALYTLVNSHGLRVDITNFGGRIVSLYTPDRHGKFDDIVTGYGSLDEYLANNEMYFGALIGRYGNRIGGASFSIDGQTYRLIANNGPNCLHGGQNGFHNVVWDAEQTDSQSLRLSYLSPDMEEGFPGNLHASVLYSLTDSNELIVEYTATSDKATHVNLTNHAYFNLAGEGNRSVYDHLMMIAADNIVAVNENQIPLGAYMPIEGTPFDFRKARPVGERIDDDHIQLSRGYGYDHCYVLDKEPGALSLAASVHEPVSGRIMEVFTTEPGVQFYSGNFISGDNIGKRGEIYGRRTSFCLETQHFPDSPNQEGFPSTLLRTGETYRSKTIHRFSVDAE